MPGKHSRDRLLLQVLSTHTTSVAGYPCALTYREENSVLFRGVRCGWFPLPLDNFSATSHVRQATPVSAQHSATLAPCVRRLFVRYSCKLIRPLARSKPPTVHNPYLGCRTSV